ncbi:MAG: VOC family protein [Rhodobacteraceae bacterium]|nr:VOC family protein [Paracoccaceae bacterium]
MDLTPYLTFPGTCLEACEFYAEVFGGDITFMQRVANSPAADQLPAEVQDQVLHAALNIAGRTIYASDATMTPYEPVRGIYVQVTLDDRDRASRIFSRLKKDGEVIMPFERSFWASGFGICRDRFGTPWIINCPLPAGG